MDFITLALFGQKRQEAEEVRSCSGEGVSWRKKDGLSMFVPVVLFRQIRIQGELILIHFPKCQKKQT